MILKLGITGTRNGMNKIQEKKLKETIEHLLFEQDYTERVFHHGQCVGVDVETSKILKNKFSFTIHSHPPIKDDLLGYSENDRVSAPKSYFARNRDIVDSSNIMLVIPKENSPQQYGGTWYTYKYARSKNKRIYIIYPNGTINA